MPAPPSERDCLLGASSLTGEKVDAALPQQLAARRRWLGAGGGFDICSIERPDNQLPATGKSL